MPKPIGWIVVLLALAGAAHAGPRARKPAAKKLSAKALKGRLVSVKGRKAQVQRELRQTRAHAGEVRSDLKTVDAWLGGARARLARTETDLRGAQRERADAAQSLQETTAALSKVRAQARGRLRAIASRGTPNVLVGFVTARSVGDLAERQELMRRVALRDHALFERVRDLQRRAEASKRRRDVAVGRVASLVRRQAAQQSELSALKAQKGRTLVVLQQKAGELESALKQFEADEAQIARLIALAARRPRRAGSPRLPAFAGRFRRPLGAPVTSTFGRRFHPILHVWRMHSGVDFGAPVGTAVHAAGSGEVIAATCMRGFGNVVIVDHGGGVSTVYGHLSRIGARVGQRVAAGQTVGAVGNTGLSTGPHLHWEVHVNGRAVNPLGR